MRSRDEKCRGLYKRSNHAALMVAFSLQAVIVGAVPLTAHATTLFVPADIPPGTQNVPLPDARAAAIKFSGITVASGDVITITATGTATGGPGFGSFNANGAPAGSQAFSGPVSDGEFPNIVGPPANIYSLVGTIHNSNATLTGVGDEWFLVGTSLVMTADRAGELAFVFHDALYREEWTPAYFDNTGGFNVDVNRPPDCSGVSASPSVLWPPNHELRLVTLSGATDPDGDTVTLTITAVTQDEPLNGLGDGDMSPDAKAGTQSNNALLRAERSGRGNGRVDRVSFTGSDGEGGSCSGTVTIGVPKDTGGGSTPIDSAPPSFNSFGP